MSSWLMIIAGAVVALVGVKFMWPRTVRSVDALDPNPVYKDWGGDRLSAGLAFVVCGLMGIGYGAKTLGFIEWAKAQLY